MSAPAAGPGSDAFDVIVIGAGPAGEVAAGKAADAGLRTLLVERELVGGECSFYACMPSKALLRPGALVDETRRVDGVTPAEIETIATLRRRDEVIHELDDSAQLPWVQDKGIALLRGEAQLDGPRRVRVRTRDGAERLVTATRAVVLATGSGAEIPPVPGLRELQPWTNREITTARQVPPRLLILGGGVVGVEMAQAWASLGAQVTIVERSERVLIQEEEIASTAVSAGLRAHGVQIRCGADVRSARRDPADATSVLTLAGGEELRAEVLLVATGRAPRTHGIGLESIGLEPGRHVEVDDRLRVPGHEEWLYAIGDVNGRWLLTHSGKLQARLVVNQLAGRDGVLRDDGPPERVIFTDPQVAAVGPTLEQARRAGVNAVAVDGRMDQTAGGSFHGKGTEQPVRFVVDADRRVLIGATFVGPEVEDMVHAAAIAVVGEVPVERLTQAAAPFPTRSEAWLKLADWADGDR